MRRRAFGVAPARVAAALAVLAVAGVALLLVRGGSTTDEPASSPAGVDRQLRMPITVGGARLEVQPADSSRWAVRMRRRLPLRTGRRWIAVAVLVRNVSSPGLLPRALGYRIVTPARFVIGPSFLDARGARLDGKRRLAEGKLTRMHLGFQVPERVRDVTLAFDAGGIRQPSVRVRLGCRRFSRCRDRARA